jgi:hypothetical protein
MLNISSLNVRYSHHISVREVACPARRVETVRNWHLLRWGILPPPFITLPFQVLSIWCQNLFKTNKYSVSTHSKHVFFSIIKPIYLLLFRKRPTACSENQTKYINTFWGRSVNISNVKVGGTHNYHFGLYIFFFIWFVRLLALRPLLAYCASLGW